MYYKNLLNNPLWQKKRLEIFERDKWSCKACGSNENTLHAHHIYYEKNLKPWEYDNECLVTICEYCHDEIHGEIKKVSGIIAFEIIVNKKDILSILK